MPGKMKQLSLACILWTATPARAADFSATVAATRPIAYYRLDASSGKSEVGASQFTSSGTVTVSSPGPTNNRYAQFDGTSGYILTTQKGGVGTVASVMAWVNLDALPSQERHTFYVAGESENGNDLDIQFETDNVLKFFTASGGSVNFAPPPTSLIHQWHMIVAIMDAATHTRALYWDGKLAASDKGGGRTNKTTALSIGASTVFGGRYLKGGIAEVALWNRTLSANEVATIYAAGKSGPTTQSSTGAFATTAKVTAGDANGALNLKREEQIAMMFMSAFQQIEYDCQSSTAKNACNMDQVLTRLKFDPKQDPNYTYVLSALGPAWEARATPKKSGFAGFYFLSKGFPTVDATYNPSGSAGPIDRPLTERGIEGDTFMAR
jgi:hypothetical protein